MAKVIAIYALVWVCAWALPVYATAQSASADGSTSKTARTTAKKTTGSVSTAKSSSAKSSSAKAKTASGQSHAKAPAKSRSGVHSASGKSTRSTAASRKKTARVRGQKKIDSERAQAIQEALIREHYLNGEATGTWNQASEDAMRKYQADQGWQSKQVPDSRALIKLGLGPNKDHLLNPESAMTTGPDAPRASSLPPTSQSPVPESAAPSPTPASANAPNR